MASLLRSAVSEARGEACTESPNKALNAITIAITYFFIDLDLN
jgi:hypothetical protein